MHSFWRAPKKGNLFQNDKVIKLLRFRVRIFLGPFGRSKNMVFSPLKKILKNILNVYIIFEDFFLLLKCLKMTKYYKYQTLMIQQRYTIFTLEFSNA